MPPKDILDKVLDEANLPHSVDISALKQQIEEQLRLLNVRVRVRQLGKGDSTECRKLVLLQHILAVSKQEQIPVKTLAAAVGIKPAAFESISLRVKPHVDVSSTATSNKKRQKSSLQQFAGSQVRNKTTAAAASTIPALSIRLGSQVHDSHGFAQRAQQLYRGIEYHIRSNVDLSNPKKRGYLQDMQRSRATYEAACFYLVARGRKMKKKATRGSGENESQQEEEDTQLSIQDVVDASMSVSLSEFRGILPTVEQFASELEDSQRKMAASSSKRPAAGRAKQTRASSSSKQEESKEVDGAARALIVGVEEAAASGTKRQRTSSIPVTTPTFVYSPRFLEWKKRVLQDTCDGTKQAMSDEQHVEIERISDRVAVQRAADEVLRRSGLL